MRVLLIDVNCKASSSGQIVYDLFSYVNSNGNEAIVCYGRGAEIQEKGIYKFGFDFETRIHAGLARVTGFNGCFSPLSTRRLIKIIEEFHPDVIHLHELHAYFVNIAPLIEYIKAHDIPVVWTFHCEYMYTGKCGHAGSCNNWKAECGNCPAVKIYPKSLFFDQTRIMFRTKKRLLNDLKAIYVTPSEYFAKRVRESFLNGKQIKVVHNGINTKVFFPRGKGNIRDKLGIPGGKVIILSVAPHILTGSKGGSWILELAKRQNNKNWEYVLVGDGERISKPLDNVTVVPLVKDKNKLAEIYSEADCFVLCSEHETFSLTCAEALCCGVPIAGFKCDAPETIFESPWAEFVDYGDLDKLEKKIYTQLKETKTGISEYAINEFSNDKMCSAYMEVYMKLVEEL